MEEIKIYVPAVPVAQPRPRAVSIAGMPRLYQADRHHPIHDFKASCRMSAIAAYAEEPLDEPIALTALFVMPRPKHLMWKRRAMPRVPQTTGADLDNLIKSVLDALNGLMWRDDKLIYHVNATKLTAAGDEQPHVELIIWRPKPGEG